MFHIFSMCLAMFGPALFAGNAPSLNLGLSASTIAQSDAASEDSDVDEDDSDETGEVDEDIIIEDDIDSNDDEGVNN